MSGSNLTVGVTADVTDLRAKLALAQQDLRQTTAELRTAAAQARASGQGFDDAATSISAFAQKAETSRAAVKTLESELMTARGATSQLAEGVTASAAQVEAGHERMTHSGGVAREALVMMHETLMGNYTRLGGSAMVLAERTNALHTALTALSSIPPIVLAIGAATVGVVALFAEWAIHAAKIEASMRNIDVAALQSGREPSLQRQVGAERAQVIAAPGTLSTGDATEIASVLEHMNQLTEDEKDKVTALVPAFAAMFGNSVKETQEFIEKTFESSASLERYLKQIGIFGGTITQAGLAAGHAQAEIANPATWDAASSETEKFGLGLKTLAVLYADITKNIKAAMDAHRMFMANAMLGGEGIAPVQEQTAPAPASAQQLQAQPAAIPPDAAALISNTAATMGLSQSFANFGTHIARNESGGQQIGGAGSMRGAGEITTSAAGALGMMQVEPDSAFGDHTGSTTHRTITGGPAPGSYDLTDPVQNIKAGLAELARLLQAFGGDPTKQVLGGDLSKTAIGYNAGEGVARGQVQQSPAAAAETRGYLSRLNLPAPGAGLDAMTRPGAGQFQPGIQPAGSPQLQRDQQAADDGSYLSKKAALTSQIQRYDQEAADADKQAATAAAAASGDQTNAVTVAARAQAEQFRFAAEEKRKELAALASPYDQPTERAATQQVSAAKTADVQKDSDPKQRAIDDANAEMTIWQQAAQAYGISDQAKEGFDQKYQAAARASIEAVRAAQGDLAAQQQTDVLQIEAKEAQAGGTRQEIELRTAAAVKSYWQDVVQSTTLTEDQRRAAENKLAEATKQYALESATAAKEASDKALRATETRLSAEAAASRGNVAQIIAIEQQRVDAVRTVHGAESAEYFSALEQQTNAVRSAVDAQIRVEEQAGQRRIAAEAQTLKAEADAHQITKTQEMQQLEAFVVGERDAELAGLTSLMGTLAEGSAAYKAAFDARARLAEQFQIELQRLHTQEVQAAQQAADQTTRAYEQSFASIGAAGNRAFEGLVMGHMSWFKAEQTVAQGVLSSFLSLTETLLARWTAYEAAKLTADVTTQNSISTIQATSGASGWPQLIAGWLGLETAKTAATTAGAATRASADSGSGLATALSQTVARWSAAEASKTALTAGGATTRAAADSGSGLATDLSQVVARWSATEAAKTALTSGGAATRATVDAGSQLNAELAQVIARWSATEASKTALTSGGAATRSTADGGAGLSAALSQVVARWSATEASKTALTTGGAATRATADASGGFLASIGQILARWLGLETAKTAATVAQGGARTAAEATAATAGAQLVGVQARLQIAAAAAEAAAWAFADSASLGPPGLAAAPAAAAAAEGTVMGFQALVPLETGAWDTGSGGPALLHQGEMVVPQDFASGLRSAMAGGGASGAADTTASAGTSGGGFAYPDALVAGMNGDTGGYSLAPPMAAQVSQGGNGAPGASGGSSQDGLVAAIRSASSGNGQGGGGGNTTVTNTFNHNPSVAAGAGDVGSQLTSAAGNLKSWFGNISRNGNLMPPRYS